MGSKGSKPASSIKKVKIESKQAEQSSQARRGRQQKYSIPHEDLCSSVSSRTMSVRRWRRIIVSNLLG